MPVVLAALLAITLAATFMPGCPPSQAIATSPEARAGKAGKMRVGRYIRKGQWLADVRTLLAATRWLFEADSRAPGVWTNVLSTPPLPPTNSAPTQTTA
jgi:hypothetical protein